MTKKIFRSVFFVAVLMLLICFALVMWAFYAYFNSVQKEQLKTEIELVARAVDKDGMSYLVSLDTGESRITWIAADGSVLYDSENDPQSMENHAQREEIREAFETGNGESSRYSSTLTEKTVYYAQLLSDGTVIRVSVSNASILFLVLGMFRYIIIIFALALIISVIIADRVSKKIVAPLNSINLDMPLEVNSYDEISPLLTRIEEQRRQIELQVSELEERKKEFYAIIKNMNEGLVLVGKDGKILSINYAASAFFSTNTECVGSDFLTVERNPAIEKTLKTAQESGHGEMQISRNGKEYQLNASRIEVDAQSSDIVILIFDISDRVFAERNRREFTANVSHELKTPLHSIMGSAELLENNMVKPEDIPRFVSNIRVEASRLLTLIEDIIRLSFLDENTEIPMEDVDLYELVISETKVLSPLAKEKNITLTSEGEKTVINGNKRLLHEIIYNLCDNAIKYNIDGGSVKIKVYKEENNAVLIVSDTGIGIPPEDHQRVFDRFYCVDKSHSKKTGGTGLGLSIVKHAVQCMGGKISLDSYPGKGTTITVIFKLVKDAAE